MVTRGDANDNAEVWTEPAAQQVGVVVASVPAIGLPLTAVRTSTGWAVGVGVAVLGVIAVLFRPRRGRTGTGEEDSVEESLSPADDLPI